MMNHMGWFVGLVVTVVFYLAIFVLRLGWFIVPIFAFCLIVSILVGFWSVGKRGVLSSALSYVGLTLLVWMAFVDQRQRRTFSMKWEFGARSNQWSQKEVILEFVDFPGHQSGEYSDKLHDYLSGIDKGVVDVVIEFTSDFGCTRGYQIVQIGNLTDFKSYRGYSRVLGQPNRSPWPARWWCLLPR